MKKTIEVTLKDSNFSIKTEPYGIRSNQRDVFDGEYMSPSHMSGIGKLRIDDVHNGQVMVTGVVAISKVKYSSAVKSALRGINTKPRVEDYSSEMEFWKAERKFRLDVHDSWCEKVIRPKLEDYEINSALERQPDSREYESALHEFRYFLEGSRREPLNSQIHVIPFSGEAIALHEQRVIVLPYQRLKTYGKDINGPNLDHLIKFGNLSERDLEYLSTTTPLSQLRA
ncbi:hypothetical protein HOC01_00160 [archaeon]|jgi:hypothetical protein|nr:hypothetical protein [archaeon]MBT6698746.1 hypothetical protein [archaeon]